jgi:hypothetical protein
MLAMKSIDLWFDKSKVLIRNIFHYKPEFVNVNMTNLMQPTLYEIILK